MGSSGNPMGRGDVFRYVWASQRLPEQAIVLAVAG